MRGRSDGFCAISWKPCLVTDALCDGCLAGCAPNFRHPIAAYATFKASLKQAVDEWRERGALAEHEDQTEKEQRYNDWREPPFLTLAPETPELLKYGNLAAHPESNQNCLS